MFRQATRVEAKLTVSQGCYQLLVRIILIPATELPSLAASRLLTHLLLTRCNWAKSMWHRIKSITMTMLSQMTFIWMGSNSRNKASPRSRSISVCMCTTEPDPEVNLSQSLNSPDLFRLVSRQRITIMSKETSRAAGRRKAFRNRSLARILTTARSLLPMFPLMNHLIKR